MLIFLKKQLSYISAWRWFIQQMWICKECKCTKLLDRLALLARLTKLLPILYFLSSWHFPQQLFSLFFILLCDTSVNWECAGNCCAITDLVSIGTAWSSTYFIPLCHHFFSSLKKVGGVMYGRRCNFLLFSPFPYGVFQVSRACLSYVLMTLCRQVWERVQDSGGVLLSWSFWPTPTHIFPVPAFPPLSVLPLPCFTHTHYMCLPAPGGLPNETVPWLLALPQSTSFL